jgi:hypothetical protein
MLKCSNHKNMIPKNVCQNDELFICLECVIKAIPAKNQNLELIEDVIRNKLVAFYAAKQNEIYDSNRLIENVQSGISQSYQTSLKFISIYKEEIKNLETNLEAKHDYLLNNFEQIAKRTQEDLKNNFCIIKENLELINNIKSGVARSMQLLTPVRKVNSEQLLSVEKSISSLSTNILIEDLKNLTLNLKSIANSLVVEVERGSATGHQKFGTSSRALQNPDIRLRDNGSVYNRNISKSKRNLANKDITSIARSPNKLNFIGTEKDRSYDKIYHDLKKPKVDKLQRPARNMSPLVTTVPQDQPTKAKSRERSNLINHKKYSSGFVNLCKKEIELLKSIQNSNYFESSNGKSSSPRFTVNSGRTYQNNYIQREFSPTFQNFNQGNSRKSFQPLKEPVVYSNHLEATKVTPSSLLSPKKLVDDNTPKPIDFLFFGNNGHERSFKLETFDSNLNYLSLRPINAFNEYNFLKSSTKLYSPKTNRLYFIGGVKPGELATSASTISKRLYTFDIDTEKLEEFKNHRTAFRSHSFQRLLSEREDHPNWGCQKLHYLENMFRVGFRKRESFRNSANDNREGFSFYGHIR